MTETKKPSKADMLIYKALNRAIENDRLRIYLDYGKSSAFYNRLRKGTYHFKVKMEDGQGGCRYWCRCWSACC